MAVLPLVWSFLQHQLRQMKSTHELMNDGFLGNHCFMLRQKTFGESLRRDRVHLEALGPSCCPMTFLKNMLMNMRMREVVRFGIYLDHHPLSAVDPPWPRGPNPRRLPEARRKASFLQCTGYNKTIRISEKLQSAEGGVNLTTLSAFSNGGESRRTGRVRRDAAS